MRIQSIKNYHAPSMKSGLYFTKTSSVLFNQDPTIKYATNSVINVSKEGSRYIKDTQIPQKIKDKFSEIPFIKELAEKFDTFIHFHETPKGSNYNQFEHVSYAKISWADYSQKYAQHRNFVGRSPISQDLATEKMFKNIETTQLCDIT